RRVRFCCRSRHRDACDRASVRRCPGITACCRVMHAGTDENAADIMNACMRRILITNDDGYRSEGIKVLADALRALGDVTIVAPVTEASAIGHALTLRVPLRLDHISDRVFAVEGTPTDCVNIAVAQVLKALPALVVSGINKGWNLGDD